MQRINLYITCILFVALLFSGCATNQVDQTVDHSYKYKKLHVTKNSIKEVIEPGMNIFVETKYLVLRCIVSGYEGEDILLCVDVYDIDMQVIKIAFKDIVDIRIKEISGVRVLEDTKLERMKKLATYTNEPGYIYVKQEINNLSFQNGVSQSSSRTTIKSGMIIYVETKDLYGRFKVVGFNPKDVMVCEDEQSKRKVKISIYDIDELRVREVDANQNAIADSSDWKQSIVIEKAFEAAVYIMLIALIALVAI